MRQNVLHKNQATDWARNLIAKQDFCILDTETTGLGNDAQIVQIAVIDHNSDPLLDTFVQPTVPISPDATRVHGIKSEDVQNADPFNAVLLRLMAAVQGKDVVIYNAEYDLRLIKQSLRPYDIQLAFPTSDRRQCRIFTNGGSIHCAMLWYSQFVGDWNEYHGNYRWQKLPAGDHSAIGDCIATLKVIQQMAELGTSDDCDIPY